MKIETPLILFPVALCVSFLLPADCRADETASKPNVLFLCVDDMQDCVNCLGGYEGKDTHHFDYKAFTWTNKKSGKVTRGKD